MPSYSWIRDLLSIDANMLEMWALFLRRRVAGNFVDFLTTLNVSGEFDVFLLQYFVIVECQ